MINICEMESRKDRVKQLHLTILDLLKHCSALYKVKKRDEETVV